MNSESILDYNDYSEKLNDYKHLKSHENKIKTFYNSASEKWNTMENNDIDSMRLVMLESVAETITFSMEL